MIRFMIGCFLFLGWGFYVLSDGSDFEPEQRADLEPVVEDATPTAPDTDLALVDTTSVTEEGSIQDRLATALITPEVTAAALDTPDPVVEPIAAVEAEDIVEEVIEVVEVAPVVIEEPEPVDVRLVAGSRVNMRSGPSTDFAVLITLDGGTSTEVIDRNSDGWVLVRVQDTGQEGWMAERLLEPVNG